MTRATVRRVKRASLVVGAVTVVSLGALSFEVDEEHDGLAANLANDSESTTNAVPPIEVS